MRIQEQGRSGSQEEGEWGEESGTWPLKGQQSIGAELGRDRRRRLGLDRSPCFSIVPLRASLSRVLVLASWPASRLLNVAMKLDILPNDRRMLARFVLWTKVRSPDYLPTSSAEQAARTVSSHCGGWCPSKSATPSNCEVCPGLSPRARTSY